MTCLRDEETNMSIETPPAGRDSAAATKLQILATEHWSLLATRSLTFSEALSRVTIFLAIHSGAVIALALVAQADRFGKAFISIAIPLLAVVLFTGLATVSRLLSLNRDDYRWVIGMNRIRHGYLEMHPELEANFVTSPYDDLRGAVTTLGVDGVPGRARLGSAFHLLQTLPGMLAVIVAAVAGAIGALSALAFDSPPFGIALAAVGAFLIAVVLMTIWARRAFTRGAPSLEPRFPTPST
jgi:uncharacterized MnhB-related membrane protein